MIKRTIDISQGPTFLSIENDQLVLIREKQRIGSVPCEDVGVLLVDHVATTYTHSVFTRLVHFGAVIVLCGPNHLPVGMVMPMESNELTARRMRLQASAPAPLRKRLWKQIVRQKVKMQAMNLPVDSPVRNRLLAMAAEVKSGDRTNVEGQAARFYWPALFGEEFRRDPEGLPPNNLLNYGYIVLRSAVARSLVAAGLHPVFSLQHSHRNNAFALADDLLEVLRPRVDRVALDLVKGGNGFVDRSSKEKLLGILTEEVMFGGQSGPLMVQLGRFAASLLKCYEGQSKPAGDAGICGKVGRRFTGGRSIGGYGGGISSTDKAAGAHNPMRGPERVPAYVAVCDVRSSGGYESGTAGVRAISEIPPERRICAGTIQRVCAGVREQREYAGAREAGGEPSSG